MTTLTVDVQNDSILPIIKKVLKAFPGIKVIQHREKKKDPTLMTKEEFFAKIDRAENEIKNGQYVEFSDPKKMHEWLESL